jgi:hypothetical protein
MLSYDPSTWRQDAAGWGRVTSAGRSRDWLKFKNPDAPAVKREFEEDWGRTTRR